MTIRSYEMTDEQWEQRKDLIPKAKTGRPSKDNRLKQDIGHLSLESPVSHFGIARMNRCCVLTKRCTQQKTATEIERLSRI